jgi:hypothetical protein
MSRLKAMNALSKNLERQQEQATFWPELCRRIEVGQVIPFVSADVIYEQLFDMDGDGVLGISQDGGENSGGLSLEEQLSDAWAEGIGFPFNGRHRLARVALYNRVVKSRDDQSAKTGYLNWLKQALLFLAEDDPDVDPVTIKEQRHGIQRSSFADIASELGYPHPVKGQADALAQLARLNLPIYMTTSHFDFLERAILKNGRKSVRTQVCYWSGDPMHYVDDSHRTDYDFQPTPENPLVYHLFGLEAYPESMVLTEDDHLDFLAALVYDSTNQTEPRIPGYLRQALTQSSQLLLGYRLHNWDFRILFRGLINTTPIGLRNFNLAIQLNPETQAWVVSADDIKKYLKGYFEDKEKKLNFTVEYGTTANFVAKLREACDQWRR